MRSVSRYMRAGRRYCDGLFELIEPLARDGKWEAAVQALSAFCCGLEQHLEREERVLLPLIERAYGPAFGPTRTMHIEHTGMRALLIEAECAGARHNAQELSAVMRDAASHDAEAQLERGACDLSPGRCAVDRPGR